MKIKEKDNKYYCLLNKESNFDKNTLQDIVLQDYSGLSMTYGIDKKSGVYAIANYSIDKRAFDSEDEAREYFKTYIDNEVEKKLAEERWQMIARADSKTFQSRIEEWQKLVVKDKDKRKTAGDLLKEVADNYDPKRLEAPLVLDIADSSGIYGAHRHDGKAYGWVKSVKYDNGSLYAQFRDVSPVVKELVGKGHYRYRSIAMAYDYEGDGAYLMHVALLGGSNPAIGNMPPLEFAMEVNKNGIIINDDKLEQNNNNKGGSFDMTEKEYLQLQSENLELKKAVEEFKSGMLELKKTYEDKIAELESESLKKDELIAEIKLKEKSESIKLWFDKMTADNKITGREIEALGGKEGYHKYLISLSDDNLKMFQKTIEARTTDTLPTKKIKYEDIKDNPMTAEIQNIDAMQYDPKSVQYDKVIQEYMQKNGLEDNPENYIKAFNFLLSKGVIR